MSGYDNPKDGLEPEPITILVTDDYFPTYIDECGTANDQYFTPVHHVGVTYTTTQDEAGNFHTELTANDGYILLVEGGVAVFESPAFTDAPCEGWTDPFAEEVGQPPSSIAQPAPPITELPATGLHIEGVVMLVGGLLILIGACIIAGVRARRARLFEKR
jgi:hypothetical protein